MNTTKVKKFAIGAASTVALFPVVALAQFSGGVTKAQTGSGLNDTSLGTLIQRVIQFGLYIIGGLGILGFIYSGFLYITAGGEEDKTDAAKKAMTYSVIGVIVALVGLIAMNTVSGLIAGQSQSF